MFTWDKYTRKCVSYSMLKTNTWHYVCVRVCKNFRVHVKTRVNKSTVRYHKHAKTNRKNKQNETKIPQKTANRKFVSLV